MRAQPLVGYFWKAGFFVGFSGLLLACSGSAGSTGHTAPAFIVSGSVGDGSLVEAAMTATDANGATISKALSDATTHYELEIPAATVMPLTIVAKGGSDLVGGQLADFELVAVAFDAASQTVNVSPLTTLATRMAECSGAISQSSIDRSWSLIQEEMGLGLGPAMNPMNQPLASNNTARIVLANATLREVVRRAVSAMASTGTNLSADDILRQLACDLGGDTKRNGIGEGFHQAFSGYTFVLVCW